MNHQDSGLSTKGLPDRAGSPDAHDRASLESLIRADYERCHPDDTFEDLKRRARFTKEDKGFLRDWMALAAERMRAVRNGDRVVPFKIAA
jgi:hypothetical protein